MESFMDFKNLIGYVLKQLKVIIACALGMGILLSGVYVVKNTFTRTEQLPDGTTLTDEQQPYIYQARRTIYIDPIYISINDQVTDISYKVCDAYRGFYLNKEILEPIVNEFYTEFQQDNLAWREKLVNCNYRMRSILNEQYKVQDVYDQLSIDVPTGNIINLRVNSYNSELSEKVVSRFEELLSAYVAKQMGNFKHTVTEGQVGSWLPEANGGLTPIKASLETTQQQFSVSATVLIKYLVIGTVLGGMFSIFICISIFLLNKKVLSAQSFVFNTEIDQLLLQNKSAYDTFCRLALLVSKVQCPVVTICSSIHNTTYVEQIVEEFIRYNYDIRFVNLTDQKFSIVNEACFSLEDSDAIRVPGAAASVLSKLQLKCSYIICYTDIPTIASHAIELITCSNTALFIEKEGVSLKRPLEYSMHELKNQVEDLHVNMIWI